MNIITENWEVISGGIATIVAWVGGRKSKKTTEKKESADALAGMQKAYDGFVADQKERYNEIKGSMAFLRDQLLDVQLDNKLLREDLREEKKKYASLKKAFDQYRRQNAQ